MLLAVFGEKFQSDRNIQKQVRPAIDFAHAAAAGKRNHPVTLPQNGTWHESPRAWSREIPGVAAAAPGVSRSRGTETVIVPQWLQAFAESKTS